MQIATTIPIGSTLWPLVSTPLCFSSNVIKLQKGTHSSCKNIEGKEGSQFVWNQCGADNDDPGLPALAQDGATEISGRRSLSWPTEGVESSVAVEAR